MWELNHKKGWTLKNWCFWTVVLEKSLEGPLDFKTVQPVHSQGDQSWVFIGRINCWSWNSNTLATSCEELTYWKRPWCWEGLGAGGKGDDRGWDDWMASPTQWTWVWANSWRWWRAGRTGVLQSVGSQRVRHCLVTKQKQRIPLHCAVDKKVRAWETRWVLCPGPCSLNIHGSGFISA